MATEHQIKNRAIGLIGGEPIKDPNATSAYSGRSRRVIDLYDMVYEEALSLWPWTCARGRKLLTPAEEKPEWGFGYQYALPDGAISVQAAMTGGCDFEVEGRFILTDHPGPLKTLISIRQQEDWLHPLVAYLIACRLALAAVMGQAESTTLQERVRGFQQDAFLEATQAENSQGSSLAKLGSEWVLAAQTGYAPELRVAGMIPPESYWLKG